MPDIFALNDAFRLRLLLGERAAARQMLDAYGIAYQGIRREMDTLLQAIAAEKAAGRQVDLTWLFQQGRLEALLHQTQDQINQFAQVAGSLITAQQQAAVITALSDARQLMLAGLGPGPAGVTFSFNVLPVQTLQDLIGFLSDGSPLADLLQRYGPEGAQGVREALIRGISLGQGPREIAREIRKAASETFSNALRLSRTEVVRAYRTANHRMMEANGDVLLGWIWWSARTVRTCASCWAMHGSFHKLDERLDDHVSGRCTPMPRTRSWAELGYAGVPDRRPNTEPGAVIFARLPQVDQLKVLGPAKFAAYREGAIGLPDLVRQTRDPRWGTMRVERSLEDIVGAAAARDFLQKGLDLAGKLAEAA